MKRMPLNLKTLPFAIVLFVCACLLPVDDIRADSVILPNYAATNQIDDSGEVIFNGISREQTVYRSSEFPPFPIIINEIRWRPDSISGGPIVTTVSNIQVNLSTMLANPDQLSTTFSDNIGTNETAVFNGLLSITTSFTTLGNGTKAFDISVPLQTPFLFDPAKGNLLIDIRNFTGCGATLYDNAASSGTDATSRIVSSDPFATSASFADTGGGVVQIIYSIGPTPPVISSNPTNQTAAVGSTGTFSVTAVPTQVFFQWFFNDTNNPIGGATNSSLVINNVQTNQAGTYFVRVTNTYGSTYSSNALLTVLPALITSQPNNQAVATGGTAVFAVTIQSAALLSYQWFFNNTNVILDATNASLIITNVQVNQLGLYSVRVSNIYGSLNSSNASLYFGITAPNYAVNFQPDNNISDNFVKIQRVQTVYGASQFPFYPIVINELRWRPDTLAGGPLTNNISNVQINLSTTITNPDHLDSTFAQNSGTNDTIVFSGSATVFTSFTTLTNGTKAFDISLPLQTPFVYDSSKGHLLVDFRNFSGGSATLYTSGLTTSTDAVSRTYSADPNGTSASGADTGAEAMQVIYTPAPLPPTISSQPTNQSIAVATSTIFNVIAGPLPLSYQWFFNDTNNPIGGATNSSLVINNVQTNQAGVYFVRATNAYGSTFSSNALLTVNPVVITSQPINRAVMTGGSAIFDITVQSSALVTYQWFLNNTNVILDATNATLIITNVQANQLGLYSVRVSNIYGSINSSNASLSIGLILPDYAANSQVDNNAETLFVSAEREQTVYGASQFPPYPIMIMELRWRPDVIASGPTTDNVPNLQVNLSTTTANPDHMSSTFAQNIGTNDLVVFNGTMNASTAFITLSNGTKVFDISLPLQIPFVFDPSKGNLLVDWRNFSGGAANLYNNAASSTTDVVSRVYNAGDANATSATGSDSGGGAVQINYIPAPVPPTITSEPTNRSVAAGTSTAFNVIAGPPPLSYQWFFVDTNNPIAGATNSSLTFVNVQTNQDGGYFVKVTGSYGSMQSLPAFLTVIPGPLITSQPVSQTVPTGGTAVFTISAQGAPLSYQWFFNATNALPDATNASLILTNVQANQVGLYSVQVIDIYGSANSSNATLSLGIIVPNYAVNFQSGNTSENTLVNVLRLQTVYGASQFPPYPIVINELRWRPDALAGGPLTDNIPNIQINLSTTATNADHLNSTFAKNVGTNDTIVFSGGTTVFTSFTTLSNNIKAFDISLPLQTPFVYDSTKGNLLVDVRNFSGGSASLYTAGLTTITDSVSRTYSANPNGTTASGADTGAEAVQVIYTPAPLPPTISSQPTNRSVLVGSTTTFNVAAGPLPLSYQWFYNTNTLLTDATNSSLVLTNLQLGQAGTYSVVVSDDYGSTTSAPAVLTLNFPPVNVFIGSTNAMGGNSFTVPVVIAANGNENTISFSMNFNTQQVTFSSVDLGSGAADGLLLPNTSQAVSGRLGVTMQLPPGESFAPGTQEVVRVTFLSAIVSGSQVTTPINFTNQPINRFVFDAQGSKLATNFVNGSVTLGVTDFEGDVTPRQTGDHNLDIFDWTQVGRFVAALDIITNAAEFQRADTAPKSTSGDGQLKVTDWVQAGRYGAVIDAPTVVGGPTNPVAPTTLTGGPRTVNIAATTGVRGLNFTVPVILQSQGNENGVGFSVNFNPAVLKYVSTVKGSADASGTLLVNTNQAASGTVGVLVALQAGNSFTNGTQQEIAKLTFTALNTTSNGVVAFTNGPVLLAVSDPVANELAANYLNGALTINPVPTLTAGISGTSATLSWPIWGTGFNVQATGDLGTQGWTNISYSAQTNGSNIVITIPMPAQGGYFRLQHP